MKYCILGGDSFVAKNIYALLVANKCDVKLLKKIDFDITKPSDYSNFDFSDTTIIDCIAQIDTDKDTVFNTNVAGFKNFINYLNTNHKNFNYVYFSTFSTQIAQDMEVSPYIQSKILAEEFMEKNLKNYKIIRLIFPFGKGENKNRLLTKLIHKIKNDEEIIIGNVNLNLTPIVLLRDNFFELLSSEEKSINFSDGKVYSLKQIVDSLFELLKKEKQYSYKNDTTINLYSKKISEEQLPIYLLKELIDE